MNVKGEVLLQHFNKSKLRNGTKTFLEPKFFLLIVKFRKLRFSAPLSSLPHRHNKQTCWPISTLTLLNAERQVGKL